MNLLEKVYCMFDSLSNKHNIKDFDEVGQIRALEELIETCPNTAVVVVDMQKRCLRRIKESDRYIMLSYQKKVLEYCAIKDIPVVVLEYEGRGETVQELKESIEKVPNTTYLSKSSEDGFTNPKLAEKLKEWGINHVFLMGVYTDSCVIITANGALMNGLAFSTSRFGIAARYWHRQNPYLEWLEVHGNLI